MLQEDTINSPTNFFDRIREKLRKKWCREEGFEFYKVYTMFCCEDYFNTKSGEMWGDIVHLFADTLSTLTILSCLFLKVPQIMHIKKKQSGEGIYIQAMLMEITGFSIVTLYNYTNQYSMITYLEYPIILLQIYVMLYYVLKFKGMISAPLVTLGVLTYIATVIGFGLQIIPKEILSYLIPFCTPLSGFAKVTYMYGIIKAANADAVSATTWIISVSTNLARLFTVYVDSADYNLMINFTVSTMLSLGVLTTALYYQSYAIKTSSKIDGKQTSGHQHED